MSKVSCSMARELKELVARTRSESLKSYNMSSSLKSSIISRAESKVPFFFPEMGYFVFFLGLKVCWTMVLRVVFGVVLKLKCFLVVDFLVRGVWAKVTRGLFLGVILDDFFLELEFVESVVVVLENRMIDVEFVVVVVVVFVGVCDVVGVFVVVVVVVVVFSVEGRAELFSLRVFWVDWAREEATSAASLAAFSRARREKKIL